jgi:hypothetical protein
MASGSGSSSGGDVVMGGDGKQHPKGLLDAVSEIEYYYAQERRGSVLSAGFFTTRDRVEFFAIGLKSSFVSGLVTALFSPIAIGVLEKMIPIFGSTEPTSWDKFFIFLLALGYSIGYAAFICPTAYCYIGAYTKAMIRSLVGGIVAGAAAKMVVAFILYHFLYMVVLTDEHIIWCAVQLARGFSREHVVSVYTWVMEFRPVFLTSAWFVVATTVAFIAVPLMSIGAAMLRNKKLRAAGLLEEDL